MFSCDFGDPEFQILRVFSFLKAINLNQQLLQAHIVVPPVMIDLLPLLKTLRSLLQFLDECLVFFLILLHVSVDAFKLGLLVLDIELKLIELLTFVVGDIIVDLVLELLQGLLYVFWGDLLQQACLAFADLPEGFLLNLLGQVLELTHPLVGFHLEILQASQHLVRVLL